MIYISEVHIYKMVTVIMSGIVNRVFTFHGVYQLI